MVEIHLDERIMHVSERMTLEAVRVALDCTGKHTYIYVHMHTYVSGLNI